MAEVIKGFTISLDLDSMKVSSGLKDLKSSMRQMNSEMKSNMSVFDRSEKSMEKYKTQLSGLEKKHEAQKIVVAAASKEYDNMVKKYGEGSKEAQNAASRYNNESAQLNNLSRYIGKVSNEMQAFNREQKIQSTTMFKVGDAFQSVGTGLSNISSKAREVGGELTRKITMPAVGAATAVSSIFIAKGFQRLVGIDTAKAKLSALGHDAKSVDNIMTSALDSVRGTSFGLGEAATTAANAVAAGVKPGKELTRYLSLAGDTAAIAGVDMQEMGSIFNKVQTSNKIQMGEINQLNERGIPIIDLLAKQLGVAQDEVADLASAGEISAADFLSAVEEGFGGAARIMGEKSFTAALANVGAAIGRVGASFLDAGGEGGGFFSQMKPLMASFTESLDGIEEKASIIGVKFGEAFANVIEKGKELKESFSKIPAPIQDIIKKVLLFGSIGAIAIGPLLLVLGTLGGAIAKISFGFGGLLKFLSPLTAGLSLFGGTTAAAGVTTAATGAKVGLLAKAFTILTGPIGITIAAIAALGTGFVVAYKKSETFRNFVDGIKEKFSQAIEWIGNFKDGILGLFQDDGMAGIDILTSIGISQGMADKLWEFTGHFIDFYHNVKEQVERVKGVFQGVIDMFQGDWPGGRSLLEKVGLNEEQILGVENGVLKVQKFFHDMKESIGNALSGVKNFFVEQFEGIKDWWDSDGALIFDAMGTAVSKVFEFIEFTIDFALKFVVALFENFAPIIEGIWGVLWPTIQFLVENVWEEIKLVIGVAMDLIQGIISGVAAIIEGDWTRFGEILKETALSIKDRVTEFFGNLKDNALRLFGELFSGAIQWFQDMWSSVTTKASQIKTDVVNRFTELKDGAINKVTEAYNSITSWFQNMWSNVTTKARNIKTDVVNRFNELKNSTVQSIRDAYNSITKWFSDMWSKVTTTARNLKDDTVNYFVGMKDGAIDGVQKLYDGASNLFDDVKDYASGTFQNMVDGAKALPGKIGEAIKSGASKAVDGVKSLGNSMTEKLGSVVNGVIGGLNSITTKIGITDNIEPWPVPTFSTGTGQGSPSGKLTKNGKIAMDTLATVGDKGKGNGPGTRELVHYPNGKVGLYDNDATIFAPKGTTIFSNKETESMLGQIPKFSEGTGLWGSIKQLAGKAIDYITNPKKIFDDLIALVGDSFGDMSGFAGTFIKGAWSMIKEGMFGWVKGKFSEASVGKSQKWMDYKMTTPYSPNAPVPGYPRSFNDGHHYGIDYGTPVGVNITAPMAGTVTSMSDRGGGNVARLKAGGNAAQYFMHMSSVKTGKVGIGESVGKSGNTGEWTTGPHVHWQHEDPSASYVQNRNTKNPLSMIKGHLKGGQILSDGLFNLHKGEYVINPNEPTKAMKLLAIVGKKLAGKSKQTSQLPNNVPTGNNNDRIVEVLLEQNKILMESNNKMNKAINVLLGIEDKTGFEPGKAKKSIDRYSDRRSIVT